MDETQLLIIIIISSKGANNHSKTTLLACNHRKKTLSFKFFPQLSSNNTSLLKMGGISHLSHSLWSCSGQHSQEIQGMFHDSWEKAICCQHLHFMSRDYEQYVIKYILKNIA